MHDAFRLDALNRLPLSERKIAKAACDATASEDDYRRLERLWTNHSNLVPFLPVFHHIFHDSPIPEVDDETLSSPKTSLTLDFVSLAIAHLDRLSVPNSARLELWRAVFRWAMFFLCVAESLPTRHALLLDFVLDQFATFTVVVVGFELREEMANTEGFFFYLYRSWTHALKDPQKAVASKRLLQVQSLIADELVTVRPSMVDEMLHGAGGTMDDLAQMALTHGRAAMPALTAPSADPRYPIAMFNLSLRTILLVYYVLEALNADSGRIMVAVANRNATPMMMKVLTQVADEQIPRDSQDTPYLIRNILRILRGMAESAGPRPLISAIRHGLVRSLFLCCTQSNTLGEKVNQNITEFIDLLLLPSAILPSVLGPLLNALEPLIPTPENQIHINEDAPLGFLWVKFLTGVNRYRKLLLEFNARKIVYKACDNMECCKVGDRTKYGKCCGCKSMVYCSTDCQRADWKAGHRTTCKTYANEQLGRSELLSSRQQSFIRFLIHDQFMNAFPDLLIQHALQPTHVGVIAFDMGEPRTELFSPDEADSLMGNSETCQWADHLARVRGSAGHRLMYVAQVRLDGKVYAFPAPLKMNSTWAADKAKEIEETPALALADSAGRQSYVKPLQVPQNFVHFH
ncbi:hypothetical protein HMN09_01105200 [Mycena chlorophos]|uniref:MYND-type domain-containing protein n=1 Tax=Mycena chlorophos TaxID=658473 RepID=A0A8H6SCS9_MYCCL|nr:hypothetical protein HMN09_01105200 [Mycena chlorophos]